MNLTLSVDDEVVQLARQKAEALGTSVNQMVRDYLEGIAGKRDLEASADRFEQLARSAGGNSRGQKFNREEFYSLPRSQR